jgi:hypothetical protein
MQKIHFDKVKNWQISGDVRSPTAISTVCPHCEEKVVFTLRNIVDDPHHLAVAAIASCPGCSKNVRFWSVRESRTPKVLDENPSAVFMYPPAKKYYPTPDFTPDVPAPLQKSFRSTIDAFNSKNYVATAVGGRRTLEGIFKYIVPEGKRNANLVNLIETATKEADLAAPLHTLSHAIRGGGNLGAHFDPENEPTEGLARQMVELLDYLISYLYVLPDKIKGLEKSLGKKDDSQD